MNNNHIHTTYSFSPYTPTQAVMQAKRAGLVTAGIMDHDSVGGCAEFIEAGAAAGLPVTVGFELRVSMRGTPFRGRTFNNPDQHSIAYVAAHGIPHQKLADCEAFLAPYRVHRNLRNRAMIARLNEVLPCELALDFSRDILPISEHERGGSVTERHVLCGLSHKLIERYGKGEALIACLRDMRISIPDKALAYLQDPGNPHYLYDLIGVLKSELVQNFYVDAVDECPDVHDFLRFVDGIGAISAYAYLGDVTDSVTGDKKAQQFEDSYLDEFIAWLKQTGFHAVTYMPSRNSMAQLRRLMALCEQRALFQISGEDINTSRQSFVCEALARPEFAHLNRATRVLIGHELAASRCTEAGMFSRKTLQTWPTLEERIAHFEQIGRSQA